eukprot:9237647-Prorocentrum_lima.AAC.1
MQAQSEHLQVWCACEKASAGFRQEDNNAVSSAHQTRDRSMPCLDNSSFTSCIKTAFQSRIMDALA